MQIAVVYIGNAPLIVECAKTFVKELSNKRHFVTLINGILEKPRMGQFQYIMFFVQSDNLFEKIYYTKLTTFFNEVGNINAKYASLFTDRKFLGDRSFNLYMKKIESEGLILHETEIFKNTKEIELIAKDFEPIKFGD
ncbi:MAG: hypothetical protein A2086_16920 [Spirochaetes bacterium GWD1_27_9]|nr:MAG: hypothetical protein A2Z98_18190 [Spirochaetes bacterium GWB1_27_13]OHD27026.1 MAG: hypothetical protein A2Y34_18320 [Spirochaetes bacterium GWC1_27_15]OHD29437.1 MAG: hypothetical protein A2086_16920 [Spirochaetes bacterium GWD1_27_9]